MIDKDILSKNLNDTVTYQDFFGAFGLAPQDPLYLRRFKDRDKGSDPGHNMTMTPASLDKNKASVAALNHEDFGIFFVVNGDGQKNEQQKHARAQFIDFDDFPFSEQVHRLQAFPLEPSIIVKTRKSLHSYWLLQGGDINRFTGVQERLIKHFGSDKSIKDRARVMRVPGFEHRKEEPVTVTLLKFDPELKYTQEQLESVLPEADPERREHRAPAPRRTDGERIPKGNGQRYSYVLGRIGYFASKLGNSVSAEAVLAMVEADFRENCEDPDDIGGNFREDYLPVIKKFQERTEEKDPAEWSYNLRAWCDEHPGEVFDPAVIGWEAVREAGERARAADKHFDEGFAAHKAARTDLSQFHLYNKRGEITGVYDDAIFRHITQTEDLFVLGKVPYIYKHGVFVPDASGAELKTMIRKLIFSKYIKAPTIKRVYELFTGAAELQITADDLNSYPAHWINFTNGFYDPLAHCMVPHDPKYRAVNQIPHSYDPDAAPDGEQVRSWLSSIADPDDVEMLLQFAGYCLTCDTRQQKFLILRGEGGTGKSTVIRMIEAAVGAENLSNISLVSLAQHTQAARFAAFGLLGKLVNSCADLEVTALEDTSTLKKVLGEDRISAEAKGKDQIFFRNYSKLIFSTNELPIVKSEKTNGFFRRLLVLTMDRVPEKKRPDLFAVLSQEMDAFLHMCVEALERMLQRGSIHESRGSVESVQQLRNDSDTVAAFLSECCVRDLGAATKKLTLFNRYDSFCFDVERQALTRNNFYRSMRLKGFSEGKNQAGDRCFYGVKVP